MYGAAAALRSPEVQAAIKQAGEVAMAAVIWSSDRTRKQYLPWMNISSSHAAENFAALLEGTPRPLKGDTGLGAGLESALQLLAVAPCSARKVINISGDGRDTPQTRAPRTSLPPNVARDIAEASEIEINALAISNEETDLKGYYQRNVITGPDAFVVEIGSFADIATAFTRKMVREVSPRQTSSLVPRGGTVPR